MFAVWLADAGEAVIEVVRSGDSDLLMVSLLGPALILALALLGIWCLHASAVMIEGAAVILLGESGAGKSTLAAAIASAGPQGFRQIADDIVPMRVDRGALAAVPRFPQLKLPADRQPGVRAPESLPVSGLYMIDPREPQDVGRRTPLSSREATVALVSHTLSARLFGRELLADHLAFCGQAAEGTPFWHLSYAHTEDGLRAACSVLRAGHQRCSVGLVATDG